MALWTVNDRGRRLRTSELDLEDWRAQTRSFSDLAAIYADQSVNVGDDYRATERVRSGFVSANLFSLIGQAPVIGREFTEADDQPGAEPVAIIGHSVWQNRYDGDPAVLGRTLRASGEVMTIVGVMAPDMHFPNNVNIWMPRAQLPPDVPAERRDRRIFWVFGRLADGVSVKQARAELAGVGLWLGQAHPSTNEHMVPTVVPFAERAREGQWRPLLMLQGALVFVFLIACANVANLLLVRAARRSGEMSVRAALGASRWRVVRQLLVESGMLASLAGLAGYGLSVTGVRWLASSTQISFMPYGLPYELTVDWVVFVFLAAIGLTTVVFGLAPALLVSKSDVNGVLKEDARAGGSGVRARRWTSALIVAELALTLALLSGAGVLVRSFLSGARIEPGVNTSPLLTMRFSMLQPQYTEVADRTALFRLLEDRLGGIADIEASAIATRAPLEGGARLPLVIEGRPTPGGDAPRVTALLVSDAYFDTVGVRLLRGRVFTPSDGLPGQETAIVNRRFAAMHFPGEDPVGRRIRVARVTQPGDLAEEPWLTIVGVTPDIRQIRAEPVQTPVVYRPHRTESPPVSVLVVRARRGDPADLTAPVLEAMRGIDPDLAFFFIRTMEQLLVERLSYPRFLASGSSTFALVALLLSAVGLYAVTASSATQRTREIGLRVALGARPGQVQWLVLRLALWQLGIGLSIGVVGALGVSRLLRSQRFGTSPLDPTTLLVIVAVLTCVAIVACAMPARRAARLDPMQALRSE